MAIPECGKKYLRAAEFLVLLPSGCRLPVHIASSDAGKAGPDFILVRTVSIAHADDKVNEGCGQKGVRRSDRIKIEDLQN